MDLQQTAALHNFTEARHLAGTPHINTSDIIPLPDNLFHNINNSFVLGIFDQPPSFKRVGLFQRNITLFALAHLPGYYQHFNWLYTAYIKRFSWSYYWCHKNGTMQCATQQTLNWCSGGRYLKKYILKNHRKTQRCHLPEADCCPAQKRINVS